MSVLKIVHVLPALTKGGAERVAVDLANSQAAAGNDVDVICAVDVDHSVLRNYLSSAVKVQTLAPMGAGVRDGYSRLPAWIWRRRDWFRSRDIIHCHLTFGAAVGGLLTLLRKEGKWPRPIIVETNHAVGMAVSKFRRWIHALLLSHRDAVVLMAKDSYWSRYAAIHPLQIVRTIANGIAIAPTQKPSLDEKADYRRAAGIPESCELLVGTVGQLREDRQPWLFIPIFADIAARLGPNVHFIMAGAGTAKDRVCKTISDYGLSEQVHLMGQVPSAGPVLNLLDLYLTLAVGSVVGLAALEAAFASVPILAIQLRPDYIPNVGDWVWSSQRLDFVAERATELLCSPQERADLGRKQNQTASSRYSIETMAAAYNKLYHDAMTERAAELARRHPAEER